MKRFLLMMVCATMMVCANAANSSHGLRLSPASMKLVKNASMKNRLINANTFSGAKSAVKPAVKPSVAPARDLSNLHVAKAESTTTTLDGLWIDEHDEDMTKYVGETFTSVTSNKITTEVENDTTWVHVEGALEGYADLWGYLSKDGTTLTFPVQYCYDDEDYGLFLFGGIGADNYIVDYVLSVTTDDNGNVSFSNDEDDWCILMTEGDYEGYSFTEGTDLYFFRCNYRFCEYESHINDAGDDWTDLAEDSCNVYLESIDGDVFVHGMFGTTISMSYNETTNYYDIPNGQPVTWFVVQASSGYAYKSYVTYNCDASSGSTLDVPMNDSFDPDETFTLNAYASNSNYLVFGSSDGSSVDWDYMYVARFVSAQRGYFDGIHCAMYCHPISGDIEGIETVNANTVVKSSASYNLAGQKVSKNFKGISIQNGKKVIK